MGKLTISKVAREAGVNLETVRFYENQGLLPKTGRTSSGYRIFSEESVTRLKFIKRSQQLGFSLKEIKDLLDLQVKAGVSCTDVRLKAQKKIQDVDEKIHHLQAIRKALEQITATCSGRGPLSGCSILHSLNEGESEWQRS